MPDQEAVDATPVRLSVTLPRAHYEHLVKQAELRRVSLAWMVRMAVEHYIAGEAPLFVDTDFLAP